MVKAECNIILIYCNHIQDVVNQKKHPAAVDLFCGAGGLSYGMQKAGIRICAGIDIDPSCRHPFEANVGAPFHEKDASDLTPEFVASLYPKKAVRILAGCAPCQPFSCYTHSDNSKQWNLLSKFGEMIEHVRPDIITMENVPGLTRHPVFRKYLRTIERGGYDCHYEVINAAEYGVPQERKRLVLLASRLGKMGTLRRTHGKDRYVTVKDTIRHLSRIVAGESSKSDRLHRSCNMSDKNLRRIRRSVPGGTWKDWNAKLRSSCHKKGTGSTYGSVYGRMEWDKPAPTITTQFHGFGSGRFGHPRQDRAISLREGALLQTFPENYSFVPENEEISIRVVSRMVGNAVPVRLGTAIGRCIMRHIGGGNVR